MKRISYKKKKENNFIYYSSASRVEEEFAAIIGNVRNIEKMIIYVYTLSVNRANSLIAREWNRASL